MIDLTAWMNDFLQKLNHKFENHLWFVGLQGSYGRGEATETSDIDIVVILDELSASDIQKYNAVLDTLPHRELICGFVSGKDELLNWEPSDLFQFYYDTIPIQGSLDELLAVMNLLLREQLKSVLVTSITAVFIICCMKRAKIFCADCINPPLSLYRLSSFSRQENT